MYVCRRRWTSAALQLGEHPFGTDRLGRDVYSRVILGASSIFRIAGLGTLISVILGSALGLVHGLSRRLAR